MEKFCLHVVILALIILFAVMVVHSTIQEHDISRLEKENAELRNISVESVVKQNPVRRELMIGFPMEKDDFKKYTSYFGKREAVFVGGYSPHFAVDISGVIGARIVAAKDGVVCDHWLDDPVKGEAVRIDHGDGTFTEYWHLSACLVKEKKSVGGKWIPWEVKKGEQIGNQGGTGLSKGHHLHFQYEIGGRLVSPVIYFEE